MIQGLSWWSSGPHFHSWGHGFDPWLGNWDPGCHWAVWPSTYTHTHTGTHIIQITSFHHEIVEWLLIGLRIKSWPKALYNLALPTYLTTSHTLSVVTVHLSLPTTGPLHFLHPQHGTPFPWSVLSSDSHLLGLSWNITTSGMLDMTCFSLLYHLV